MSNYFTYVYKRGGEMKNVSNFVIKNKYVFLSVFFVLIVASVVMMNYVTVNYDLTKYLPNDSSTKSSIELMSEEFGANGNAVIMLENITKQEGEQVALKVNQLDNVSTCVLSRFDDESGSALITIFLASSDYSLETENTIKDINNLLENQLSDTQNYYVAGSSVSAITSRLAISGEITTILLIAIAIVLVVLAFTTRSWFEPIIILLTIGTAILINMGTNYFLGEISFVSNSISSVLLIALAMDYSIVLVNRFREEREKEEDVHIAMKKALTRSFTTIIASGCTVMAGLIALTFMNYKIGFDLGMVLTKGVFISILAVIFLMPALLILFSKIIKRTEHKNFLKGLSKVGTFVNLTKRFIPIIFIILVVGASVIQFSSLEFDYVAKNGDKDLICAEQKIENTFGMQNSLAILVSNDMDNEKQKQILNDIEKIEVNDKKIINSSSSFLSMSNDGLSLGQLLNAEALSQIFSIEEDDANIIMASTQTSSTENATAYAYEIIETLATNANLQRVLITKYPEKALLILDIYRQEQLAKSLFVSNNYSRFVLNINAGYDSDEAIEYINKLNQYINDNELNINIVCNTQNVIETADVFVIDRLKVELISIIAIFLIVMLCFKSILIPFILILGIEGSIMINLAFNALSGNAIFFICYLIGTAIQMGATIDYAILLTDRYKHARRGMEPLMAIKTAIDKSFSTIITSGSILMLAAFTIGLISSVPIISSIGYLIGFGALSATITILFVIPQFLLLFDKHIMKKQNKV